MKRDIENRKNRVIENQLFELEIFNALKAYGYLLPKNTKEVEGFEKLYGKTKVEFHPDTELNLLHKKTISKEMENIDFDISLKIAAYSAGDNENLNSLDDLLGKDTDKSE